MDEMSLNLHQTVTKRLGKLTVEE